MNLFRALSRFAVARAGSTAAEFAMIIPIFLALTLGTMNLGIVLYGVSTLHFAAQKTARCIAVKNYDPTAAFTTAACMAAAPTFYSGPAFGITFAYSAAGCGNTVTGTGSVKLVTGIVNPTIALSASACYPRQY